MSILIHILRVYKRSECSHTLTLYVLKIHFNIIYLPTYAYVFQ